MNRSKQILERLVGGRSVSPYSRPIDLVVGKEYVFNKSVVQVLEVGKDKVKIAKVIRGIPSGDPKWVNLKLFYSDINRI